MKDEYYSIASMRTATLKVEGSKFIASVFPVEERDQAEGILARVRRENFDATHHCFAYALGIDRQIVRHSDDGEPSGSAGLKIFAAIESHGLSDILLVVTRYFGGTKLGVGGLGRTYFESANTLLAACDRITKIVAEELHIIFPYEETNAVMSTLSRHGAKIADTLYEEDVTLRVAVRKSAVTDFLADLTDNTRGNIAVRRKPESKGGER